MGRSPDTQFDTASLISCRDVTTEQFSAANPLERLVEAKFQVTAIVQRRDTEGMQYVYQFLSPTGLLRVVDYQPKTEQASSVAGNVAVEKKQESNKSLGLSVSGSFESLLHGTAGSDLSSKNGSNIRYELKPPMKVVLVAGTVDRGTGVYFKLRPSPARPLEGMHEFVVVMRVPRSWRGDMMYLHASPSGCITETGPPRTSPGLLSGCTGRATRKRDWPRSSWYATKRCCGARWLSNSERLKNAPCPRWSIEWELCWTSTTRGFLAVGWMRSCSVRAIRSGMTSTSICPPQCVKPRTGTVSPSGVWCN